MQSLIYLKRVGCRFRVSTAFLFQTVEKSQQFRLSRLAFCAQSSVVFLTNLCWFSRYRAIKNRTETKNYTCGYCLFDRLNKLFEKTKRKSEKKKNGSNNWWHYGAFLLIIAISVRNFFCTVLVVFLLLSAGSTSFLNFPIKIWLLLLAFFPTFYLLLPAKS